ncbi:hypothetical protein KAU86_01600 [bacterium]|nr:hypothetical protein [bacterium]MCK4325763.1 hypothetical protein [bacterium]MCK4436622.1 hypothetical protein [bacterium]
MSGTLKKLWQRIRSLLSSGEFLCDTCKYDWGNVCRRRERPNATQCPDYKRR